MIRRGGGIAIRMLADVEQRAIGPSVRETITERSVACTGEYDT